MGDPIHNIDDEFDDHPSLSASLDDFDHENHVSPLYGIPSQHSGFKMEDSETDADSAGPWMPPASFRRTANGSTWLRQPLTLPNVPGLRSREMSPQYESALEGDTAVQADELPLAAETPVKKRSPSPDPYPQNAPDFARTFTDSNQTVPAPENQNQNGNNYIRFAVRAEVQHRTEPFEAAFCYMRDKVDLITSSRRTALFAAGMAILSILFMRVLFQPPPPAPVPDLVKVAGLAKSFEPLIFYSENGVQQIGDLQETGVAVWDLGESVRSANMTSAPLIVRELDDLSESLKTLAIELTKFFANVDGDVDSILIVMEWAKRELTQVSSLPMTSFTSVFDNVHSLFCRIGLFESSTGKPTTMGKLVTDLFGQTGRQRTRQTLQRTFNEFLSVLEESINTELTYSTALFALFEAIDKQFLNLQRTVIRESDQQEREEGELLSSLWTRVLGPNAAQLRKYEKNRLLLSNVREKTVRNKHILVDHNGKLLTLKSNLEILRRKLVSPLVRSNDSSTLSVEEQIHGLDGTYNHLRIVRERQKAKLMEMLYGAGKKRVGIGREGSTASEDYGIEAA
ncbi:hypothetical protein L228DRAFT_265387 [Xylona heveae TC161]|uniref:Uncharacterized protein n=1 Tax=Xylona heveae (strain CBS 132557 / TC161) TaxID=1328760 RepID=A0A165IGU6_XYLHT|nr:hypothetical protein L228DRAFT_265387 [Xylona heveae TC161]KZF24875.1 hypothetical protein L228DRAFT_265387 [Xylona heveae TC161]